MRTLTDDVAKFLGLPPHDSQSNICRGDGYHYASMVRRYGQTRTDIEIMTQRAAAQAARYTGRKMTISEAAPRQDAATLERRLTLALEHVAELITSLAAYREFVRRVEGSYAPVTRLRQEARELLKKDGLRSQTEKGETEK